MKGFTRTVTCESLAVHVCLATALQTNNEACASLAAKAKNQLNTYTTKSPQKLLRFK